MAGIKGRSGRRPASEEEKRHRVIDKAWSIAEEYLSDPKISTKEKISTAEKIIIKNMPQELSHSGKLKVEGIKIEYAS